uniref:RNA-directed DNA polymerase n=1 Tax=Panagrolaimus superbus TaxID=310955 RepID=A0A914ZA88_9BILA
MLLLEFQPLFAEGLGRCTKVKIHLPLKKDATPFFCGPRRLSLHATQVLREVIDANVKDGVMFKVDYSEVASPCSLVPKKDGKHRLVVDYSTGLNERLEEPCYSLPLPEDIYAKLAGCKVFSILDFSNAYHQLELAEESKKYTTISTPFGLFRYNCLSQGLKTAVSDFQETAVLMLNDIPSASPYIDDVLVASKSVAEHTSHLKTVLGRIMDWGFRLNADKCKLYKSQIRFLGKLIDAQGVRPDPEKVAAIQSMPDPTDVSTLRSFLGLVNYYQQFIPSFRDLREPLDDLLKDGNKWEWSDPHQIAAQTIKEKLAQECLLTHYDPRLPIIVAADASQNGIGGVISHLLPDGQEKPIQFFSRALDSTQRKYDQTNKEALALVTAVKVFHRYLEGQKFTLLTDHKALLATFGNKKGLPILAANRLHRWALFLAAYNFDIKYKKTTEFGQADAVSRLIARTREIPELYEEEEDLDDAVFSDIMIKQIHQLPVTANEIIKAYETDEYGQTILKSLADGTRDSRFFVVNGIIMMNNRVYIPAVLRSRVLDQLHVGHNGITITKQLGRKHVYWPNITVDIEKMVNSCYSCIQLSKAPIKTTLASWPRSIKPGDRIHMDFAGPLLGKMFLVIVDSCSKWMDVHVLNAATSWTTILSVGRYIANNGVPRVVVTDNGCQFTSGEFSIFCQRYGITHVTSPVYHPQSNGQAERCVDIVKRYVKKRAIIDGPNLDLVECINEFLLCYRSTPSTATPGNVTPSIAHHGHELRTTMELLRPQLFDNLGPDDEMEAQFNAQYGAKPRNLGNGDRVYARKQKEKPWFEGIIHGRRGKKIFGVLDMDGKTHWMHTNNLIKRATLLPKDELVRDSPVTISISSSMLSGHVSPPSSPTAYQSPPAVTQKSPPPRRYPLRQRKQTQFLQPDSTKKSYD